jgi:hypothetical protein
MPTTKELPVNCIAAQAVGAPQPEIRSLTCLFPNHAPVIIEYTRQLRLPR